MCDCVVKIVNRSNRPRNGYFFLSPRAPIRAQQKTRFKNGLQQGTGGQPVNRRPSMCPGRMTAHPPATAAGSEPPPWRASLDLPAAQMDQTRCTMIFLVTASSSTLITSNKSFGDWQELFGEQVIATAILDRLLHHCRVINIKGHSYRLRGHSFSKNDFATAGTAAPVVDNGKTKGQ